MLVKVFHQHAGFSPTCIFRQHPSPTLKQPIFSYAENQNPNPQTLAVELIQKHHSIKEKNGQMKAKC